MLVVAGIETYYGQSQALFGMSLQVGEGEVRQESPDADEVLEVRYLSLVEVRMRTGQVGQRRHVPTPLSAASAQLKPTGLSDPAAAMST